MMFTARLHQAAIADTTRWLPILAITALACAIAAPPAYAGQGDCTKPVDIRADHNSGYAKPNGVVRYWGHVIITQCTLKITAANATVQLDADLGAKRVVLTGAPAHVQQVDEFGNLAKLQADNIDYVIATGVATLTGAVHGSRGGSTISSARTVYNTRTGAMHSSGNNERRVHTTFKPHQSTTPAAPASRPAPASTTGVH